VRAASQGCQPRIQSSTRLIGWAPTPASGVVSQTGRCALRREPEETIMTPQRDPELQAIFDALAEIRERHARGECDPEGRPTAVGRLVDGAQRVEPDQ